MGQNNNVNNNFLRGAVSGTRLNSTGTNSLRESGGEIVLGEASVVDNQLRPYASDDTDPSNRYLANIKYGTTEHWNSAAGFIPGDGEIIVYTDYQTITKISPVTGEEITMPVPAIKIGTGNAYVQDLALVDEWERDLIYDHIHNTDVHVSPEDKQRWNNKLNYEQNIQNETLVLNRN
jgi:hypothetical protein